MSLVFGELHAADVRRLALRAEVSQTLRNGDATPVRNADAASRAVTSHGATRRRRRIVCLLCAMVLTGSSTLGLLSPHAAAWESKAGSGGPSRSSASIGCLTGLSLLTHAHTDEVTTTQSEALTP